MTTYLVYYDGKAVNINGDFCYYSSDVNYCKTDALTYDGKGVKPFSDTAPLNQTCTGGTFVVYDGTGLKPTSYSNRTCVSAV